MASEGDLVAIRMKLLGGKEAAAEADAVSESIAATGTAAEEASAKSAQASKASSAAAANAARASKKQISAVRELGGSLTKYVTTPLVAIAGASVYMASNFKRQMGLIATDAGGTTKEVVGLEKSVINLSRESQYGPKELAESLFHIESAGYRGAKAMEVLKSSVGLATAGNSDLESTTYGLVSAQKALFGKGSVAKVKTTASELNQIVSHGDIRLEELVAGMGSGLIEKAVEAGVSLRSVGSALDVMTARGIPAQRASYALGFIFTKLVPTTKPAIEAFEQLGLGQEALSKAAAGPKGWPAMIELLQSKLKGMSHGNQQNVISKIFGGGRMDVAVLASLQNLDDLKGKFKDLNPDVALYNKHVKEAEEQPLIKMKKSWAAIEASLVEVGGHLLPIVVPGLEKVAHIGSSILEWVSKLPGPSQKALLVFAGVAALAGPVLSLAGNLAKATMNLGEFFGVEAGSSAASGSAGMAGVLGGGLVKAIPYAFAAAGVGNTVVHAVKGETSQAIAGGAGAAIGGAIGLAVGGPMGAALGVGIGSFAGPAILKLFQSGPTYSVLHREMVHLGSAVKSYGSALKGLDQAEHASTAAAKRHHTAIVNEHAALHNLAETLSHSGPNSVAALRAQRKLAAAENAVTRAAHREAQAHQLSGLSLRLYRKEAVHMVASIKQALPNQRAFVKTLLEEADAQPNNVAKLREAVNAKNHLSQMNQRLTKTLGEASEKGGRQWAQSLSHMSTEQAKFGTNGVVLKNKVAELRAKLGQLNETGMKSSPMWQEMKTAIGEATEELSRFQENVEGVQNVRLGPHSTPNHGPGEAPHKPGASPKHPTGGNLGKAPHSRKISAGTGPISQFLKSPDSRPTEYWAPTGDTGSGGGTGKTLQPITVQVGRRVLASVVAETNADDDARL